ncbi:vascular cell adhesion protein 1 [Brachyhypopomus gauderio]|uniref:vascular cell adhesion protein 1 n=1 Tax=Brachyhypopomus gauderio TaxID=698409 RepID=UPI0040426F1F
MNRESLFVFGLCIAALNLFTGKHAMRVFLEPKDKTKHINDSFELICTVTGCSGEIIFTWKTLLDYSIGAKIKTNLTVSRLVFNKLTTEHDQTFVCNVKCGENKQNKAKIRIYSFPTDPVISRADALNLQCVTHNVYPPSKFNIKWFRGDTHISGKKTDTDEEVVRDINSTYTPTEEDRGKNITCKVTLNMDGVPEDRAVRTVTVQYGPQFVAISGNTAVRVGGRLELRCDTDRESNVTWTKLGTKHALVLGNDKELVFEQADWSHAGKYECEARAELGSRRTNVSVTILGPPEVPKIRLSQTTEPREGDNITIFCHLDSIPSVNLTISRTSLNYSKALSSDHAYVSINIPSIQREHSGLYHCDSFNEFGGNRSSIDIKVQERLSAAPNLPKAIIPAVGSVPVLGAAAVLIRYLWRLKKKSQDSVLDELNL